jgi:hypothetical protein
LRRIERIASLRKNPNFMTAASMKSWTEQDKDVPLRGTSRLRVAC